MSVFEYIKQTFEEKGAAYLVLIDPDKMSGDSLGTFVKHCENSGVDGFLVGGSLMFGNGLEESIRLIKTHTKLPAVIFPGAINQVTPGADALLFISLVSGRNPHHLIGKHVLAAPLIKKFNIEAISTGYMLIESGKATTAEYMSNSVPIPRGKPEIAMATALAAQYMGMKMVYLEAGSGAEQTVPDEMIKLVSSSLDIPVIVGGGIKDSRTARAKVESGAKVIVTGNFFEDENNWDRIKEFADAVHIKKGIVV